MNSFTVDGALWVFKKAEKVCQKNLDLFLNKKERPNDRDSEH